LSVSSARTFLLTALASVSVAMMACAGPAARDATDSLASDPARSDSGVVRVRLRDGRVRTFVDRGDEESIVKHHDNGPLRGMPFHVIFREMWEAWDYVLVDVRSGDSVVVPGEPIVSPGGRRFATSSMDFEVGYAPTIVEVWRLDPDSLRLEWREESGQSYPENTGWGVSEWRWEDDSTATIVRDIPNGIDGPIESRPAKLQLRAGRWQLIAAPPDA
jgi:hypothetical protein